MSPMCRSILLSTASCYFSRLSLTNNGSMDSSRMQSQSILRKFFADDIERNWTQARQETVFSVDQTSVDVFTTLSFVIILTSVFMFWLARKHNQYLSLYPDITFGSRSEEEMGKVLEGSSIASSGEVIRKLDDSGRIWVTPVGQNVLIMPIILFAPISFSVPGFLFSKPSPHLRNVS